MTENDNSQKFHLAVLARDLTGGGVQRVINELLRNLDESYTDRVKVTVIHSIPEWKDNFPFEHIEARYIPSPHKLVFDFVQSGFALLKISPDAVIYSKNIIPFTHFPLPHRKYNIIYDLGYFEKSESLGYGRLDTLFMKSFMGISCRTANHTFSISQFSKDRAIAHLNLIPETVTVIPLGVSPQFFQFSSSDTLENVRTRHNIQTPFLFYAGSLSPRKNLLRVIQAFSQIRDEIPHNLYITGIMAWKTEGKLKELLDQNQDRIKLLGFVNEEDLPSLYKLSEVYLFPSLYEGFGLPILEAQISGTPVLTSDRGSMKEVAGESAKLVDPYSIEDIKTGITELVNSPHLQKTLIDKGYKNLERYSWEKMTATIFQTIVKHDKVH